MTMFSQLVVVGDTISSDELYSKLLMDLDKSVTIVHVPDAEACLSRLNNNPAKSDALPSAILLSDFSNLSTFECLQTSTSTPFIFGVPSLYTLVHDQMIWKKIRPVFCFSMKKAVISITGFRDRSVVNHLATLVHWMGGSVRRHLDPSVTHLVAYRCEGEKVQKAALTSAKISTVKASWVEQAWQKRSSEPFFDAASPAFVYKHRAKVFQSFGIIFVGFPAGSCTVAELQALVKEHDGTLVDGFHDGRLTHIVVADDWPGVSDARDDMNAFLCKSPLSENKQDAVDSSTTGLSVRKINRNLQVSVVRLDWFWKSLQSTYVCDPNDYLFTHEPMPLTVSRNRRSLDIFSPRSDLTSPLERGRGSCAQSNIHLTNALDKENADPIVRYNGTSIKDDDEFDLQSCISPWSSERNTSDLKSAGSGKEFDSAQNFSARREDLLAHLADPHTLRGNRDRYLRSMRNSLVSSLDSPIGSSKTNRASDPHYHDLSTTSNLSNSACLLDATQASDASLHARFSACFSHTSKDTNLSTPVAPGPSGGTKDPVLFNPNLPKTPLDTLRSSFEHSPLFHRGSPTMAVDNETPLKVRLEKRRLRVFEFFLTESNYLEILEYLTQTAFSEVVADDQVGGAVLPRTDADMVFGKLVPIYQLHKRLQESLTALRTNWNNATSCIGPLMLPCVEEMDKVYCQYTQFYSAPYLHQLGQEYPRFLAFMRQVERRKASGRQSLSDLLVRPVQRLPSMLLLMQGILKFTPSSHADHADVASFVEKLSCLLSNINVRLKKNEEHISLLTLYHEINDAPPEMLSSSRSLVSRLSVFQLGVTAASSGVPLLEPVTLFLLTDCLEVARPKKRHTGERRTHAIQAALAAVQGEPCDGSAHDDRSTGDGSSGVSCGAGGGSVCDSMKSGTISRKGSGASNSAATSKIGLGRTGNAKKRHYFNHLFLLKLQDIKRVLNLNTQSPERAAFSLIVRGSSELHDHVYTFCLAASFAATDAVAQGRCPKPVESAITAAAGHHSSAWHPTLEPGLNSADSTTVDATTVSNPSVATLQQCVNDAKNTFLRRLCHHIIQVSCLASSPDELLIDMPPEDLLGFDLETVFSLNGGASKSKKFPRQLGRAISLKTPRQKPSAWNTIGSYADKMGAFSVDHIPPSKLGIHQHDSDCTSIIDDEIIDAPKARLFPSTEESVLNTPSRLSVLGGLLSGLRSKLPATPIHSVTVVDEPKADPHYTSPEIEASSSLHNQIELASVKLSLLEDPNSASPFREPCSPPERSTCPKPSVSHDLAWLDEVTEYAYNEDDDDSDSDLLSLDSYTTAGSWQAFVLPQAPPLSATKRPMVNQATASVISLRSTTESTARRVDCVSAKSRISASSSDVGDTRKSIRRSVLNGLRNLGRSIADPWPVAEAYNRGGGGRKSTATGHRKLGAPIAEDQEGNAEDNDSSEQKKTTGWFARHRLTRLRSADFRSGTSTPSLDKSVSECNLSSNAIRNRPCNLATSSTTSLKNPFASPFRAPTCVGAPLIRQSTAAPERRRTSHQFFAAPVALRDESFSPTSWNSIHHLDNDVDDLYCQPGRLSGIRHGDIGETCSLILPPPAQTTKSDRSRASLSGSLYESDERKRKSFGGPFVKSKLLKQSKKASGVRLFSSSILSRSTIAVSDRHIQQQHSNQSGNEFSRRDSFFRRSFLKK